MGGTELTQPSALRRVWDKAIQNLFERVVLIVLTWAAYSMSASVMNLYQNIQLVSHYVATHEGVVSSDGEALKKLVAEYKAGSLCACGGSDAR